MTTNFGIGTLGTNIYYSRVAGLNSDRALPDPSGGIPAMSADAQTLIEKLRTLPPDRLAVVEEFVDFIRLRERHHALTRDATIASAPAFAAIWSNPEDDVYDAL